MNNDLANKLKNEVIKSLTKNPQNSDAPYLVCRAKTYTRKELALEIENETEFGVKIISDVLMLSLDLTARNKTKVSDVSKINLDDVKVGYELLSYDVEDQKWYKTEVIKVVDDVVTLKDVDHQSDCQGMIWESDFDELQEISLHKQL